MDVWSKKRDNIRKEYSWETARVTQASKKVTEKRLKWYVRV